MASALPDGPSTTWMIESGVSLSEAIPPYSAGSFSSVAGNAIARANALAPASFAAEGPTAMEMLAESSGSPGRQTSTTESPFCKRVDLTSPGIARSSVTHAFGGGGSLCAVLLRPRLRRGRTLVRVPRARRGPGAAGRRGEAVAAAVRDEEHGASPLRGQI